MVQHNLVALLTDFGLEDVYVGVMKGAIAKINPHLQVIDLTHNIPPQDLFAARFALLNAYKYFPENTVYVAVVDPGVGSDRRGVAIQFPQGWLVGPDNGIFTGILDASPAIQAVELTNSNYWLTSDPSNTFHGRDIFAPVGAHLAGGIALEALGESISLDSLVTLSFPPLQVTENAIAGSIQYCDRFGNLITNIPVELIREKKWQINHPKHNIPLRKTYSEVAKGEPIALVGSHGYLEIAVNGGSAKQELQLTVGQTILLMIENKCDRYY
ncbi:MAG: S-adenosyl-l-methionine hydroxide adenosyltransferase family protein [Xenococcus sp. (in: cyanobacteria)]